MHARPRVVTQDASLAWQSPTLYFPLVSTEAFAGPLSRDSHSNLTHRYYFSHFTDKGAEAQKSKVLASDPIARIQKGRETCRTMSGLLSPSQSAAQTLLDDAQEG